MSKKFLLPILALLWSVPAYASHPLITDDTGTQGSGHFQLELNNDYGKSNTQQNGVRFKEHADHASAILSCGIRDNIDLIATLPWQWHKVTAEGITADSGNGVGDTTVDVKWRFSESRGNGTSFALKPGFSIPTGDENKGFGNGRFSGKMMLIVTHEGSFGALHCNLGYTRNEYMLETQKNSCRNDIWHLSLASVVNLTGSFKGVGNIGIETNPDLSTAKHTTFIVGGVIYSPTKTIDLDLGLKGGFNDTTPGSSILAGLTERF
jgi:hypothetical protein